MLADERGVQAGPSGEETVGDGFAPRVYHWAPCAEVEVGDEVHLRVHGVDVVGEGGRLCGGWRRGWFGGR